MDEEELMMLVIGGVVFFLFFLAFIFYPFGADVGACLIAVGIMCLVVVMGVVLGFYSKSKLKCKNCGKECGMLLCPSCQEKKKVEAEKQMKDDLLDFE